MDSLKVAVSLGLVVFSLALFTPALVDATNEDRVDNVEIQDNSTEDLTDRLSVDAEQINPAADATITVRNTQSLNESQQTLNESETRSYVLDGETVSVTLQKASSEQKTEYVQLAVEYPNTFGWSRSAAVFIDNLGLLLVAISFMTIIGLLVVVIKQ